MGVPLPAGDPYDIPDIPRSVVKAWITITLGSDRFHRRWPGEAKQKYAESDDFDGRSLQEAFPIGKTKAAILEHLPLLKDWPTSPIRWGDLQFLESEAVIDAVHSLAMAWGIPALPLHDAVIVPKSKAELAKQVLSGTFHQHVGVLPSITVKG